MTVTKIGMAKESHEILAETIADDSVDEILVITSYRAADGSRHWRYRHSPLHSKFNLIGVMQWVANALIDDDTFD